MGSPFHWDGNFTTSKSLRLDHDGARAQLVLATMTGGRIATAAGRLVQMCVPHF